MVDLADLKRREYEPFAPTFQRPAPNAMEVHRPWFAGLAKDPDVGTFVHEDTGGEVDGFVIVTTGPAPPVYDPGGATALIDDFTVASPELWQSAGAALLDAASQWAARQGAVQLVVVSGPHDAPKRALLEHAGLYVASEWFTTPLAQ
jgi:GNAT superfamily N-acetyltransferase